MVTMREGRCANGQFLEKTVKLILQRFMKIFISLIITIILFIYLFAEACFKYRSNEAWPARVASVNVCVWYVGVADLLWMCMQTKSEHIL